MVKYMTGLLALIGLVLFGLGQEKLKEESLVVNIEVPVRVFEKGRFVPDLKLDDFELYEDGVLQKVDAVYLINKRTIERSEEKKKFVPKTNREFYLFFEITEFLPRLGDALEYFIEEVYFPGDRLTVVTPIKTYRLKDQTFERLTKKEVVKQLREMLRRDALIGSSDYRNAINSLAGLVKALTAALAGGDAESNTDARLVSRPDEFGAAAYKDLSLDLQLTTYAALLSKLDSLRFVDQKRLLDYAGFLKTKEGQKYVFLFYQKEFIPEIEPRIINQYLSLYQDRPDILHTVSGLFDFYKRDIPFDVDLIKRAYSDSTISMHFLYITKPPEDIPGVRMEEHSEDIYAAFREMALASGGFVDSSANPRALFRNAVEASETYYLVYYAPKNYRKSGQFKDISVRIKNRNDLKVVHRAGYYSN